MFDIFCQNNGKLAKVDITLFEYSLEQILRKWTNNHCKKIKYTTFLLPFLLKEKCKLCRFGIVMIMILFALFALD